jgi:hypothetical protein
MVFSVPSTGVGRKVSPVSTDFSSQSIRLTVLSRRNPTPLVDGPTLINIPLVVMIALLTGFFAAAVFRRTAPL